MLRSVRVRACLGLLFLLTAACAGTRRSATLEQPIEVRRPLVLIPGITGTRLRDRESGKRVWGDARRMFGPRDGGYSVALPLDPATESTVEAEEPLTEIRLLGLVRVDVYASLLRALQRNGYTLGDLRAPRPQDDLFVFPYDWRASHVDAAAELARLLAELGEIRGESPLSVDVICHSNAVSVARYLAKYGAASLEEAGAGAVPPHGRARIHTLLLVGSATGGAMGTLEDLNRGRRYVPLVGRRFLPEALFTFPALFEALPAFRDDLFVDEAGALLPVDIWDAQSWRTYGWSIFAEKTRQRLARADSEELFGDPQLRFRQLSSMLARALALHELLQRDPPGFRSPRIYSIQSAAHESPDRVMLERVGERWETRFSGDRKIRRDPYLASLMSEPGDGHVTLDSQSRLSAAERAAIVEPAIYVRASHRKLLADPAAQRHILRILADENRGGPP